MCKRAHVDGFVLLWNAWTSAFEEPCDEITYWHVSLEMHSGIEMAKKAEISRLIHTSKRRVHYVCLPSFSIGRFPCAFFAGSKLRWPRMVDSIRYVYSWQMIQTPKEPGKVNRYVMRPAYATASPGSPDRMPPGLPHSSVDQGRLRVFGRVQRLFGPGIS